MEQINTKVMKNNKYINKSKIELSKKYVSININNAI